MSRRANPARGRGNARRRKSGSCRVAAFNGHKFMRCVRTRPSAIIKETSPNCRRRENEGMKTNIHIVDCGRGLQLSTSRITVQDLVPYFQEGYSYDEIIRLIPALTHEEIAVVESFYRQHQKELDEEDRIIRERIAQRRNPPDMEEVL